MLTVVLLSLIAGLSASSLQRAASVASQRAAVNTLASALEHSRGMARDHGEPIGLYFHGDAIVAERLNRQLDHEPVSVQMPRGWTIRLAQPPSSGDLAHVIIQPSGVMDDVFLRITSVQTEPVRIAVIGLSGQIIELESSYLDITR